MENMQQDQVIGISSAARLLEWSAGKFGGYFYSGRAPTPQIIDNRPVWVSEVLLEWKKSEKYKKLNGKKISNIAAHP